MKYSYISIDLLKSVGCVCCTVHQWENDALNRINIFEYCAFRQSIWFLPFVSVRFGFQLKILKRENWIFRSGTLWVTWGVEWWNEMKHEFETSILCAESEFPTYPRPSTARIASNAVKRNLNWNFLDGSTLAGTNYVSTYNKIFYCLLRFVDFPRWTHHKNNNFAPRLRTHSVGGRMINCQSVCCVRYGEEIQLIFIVCERWHRWQAEKHLYLLLLNKTSSSRHHPWTIAYH